MSLDVYIDRTPCPHCKRSDDGYSANITHNLAEMADKAGMYEALWHPERIKEEPTAADIIPIIETGLSDLLARPEYFQQFNASNGWGMYKHFVPFVTEYLAELKKDPTAKVRTWT